MGKISLLSVHPRVSGLRDDKGGEMDIQFDRSNTINSHSTGRNLMDSHLISVRIKVMSCD